MTTLLAVSPHLDDAIFSAGGLLWNAARRGVRVVVATVFTGNVPRPTGFALACQLDKGLSADCDYMALRREEDRLACAAVSADPRHLPLLEAPHRGYGSAAALFAGVREDDRAGEEVRSQLAALIAELQPPWLLGPLGIGGHADHLIVHDALRSLARGRRLWWWEDWPYLDRAATDPSARTGARRLPLSRVTKLAKAKGCSAYASQLAFQFGNIDKLERRLAAQTGEWFHSAGHRGSTLSSCIGRRARP